ncbi:dehydrogenase, FMN-dependent [Treponema phagedenis F0421]|nr:dehydrogenase, FMN-dependent [Treponema phagedenis F0421]
MFNENNFTPLLLKQRKYFMIARMCAEYKCYFCETCEGLGCTGELPGMGGVFKNANFIANCAAWKNYHQLPTEGLPEIRLAPITGGVENIGYPNEEDFYFDVIEAALEAGIRLSIGDGCPDIKLQSGIAALKQYRAKAAVFIKPYPNKKFFERIDWAREQAEIIGIDIDSYNIVTMRNLVNLEKKNAQNLQALQRYAHRPFAVKGIFTDDDIETMRDLKPDIIVISNHGGRIETRRGSTANFLAAHGKELRQYCGELWVDGGLRCKADLLAAKALGASQIMLGRPCITALLRYGKSGIKRMLTAFQ